MVTCFSQGVNQSAQGTDKVNAIINCHLATGRIGRPGMGPLSLTGQPNAMGGREVGGLANMLAAHMGFSPDEVDRVRRFWNAPRMAEREGLKAVGRKTTSIIPAGQIGNDRPIEITDERWESPELRMLIYSRSSDPRTGVIEYRLTGLSRAEPPPDLSVVPQDYTVVEPGAGGRGRGGRGGPAEVK